MRPQLVQQVMVHHVQKSAPGYHVAVVPSWAGELHHYRNYVGQDKRKKVKDEYKTLAHVEDRGLITRFLTPLCESVERACQRIQGVRCRFIDL